MRDKVIQKLNDARAEYLEALEKIAKLEAKIEVYEELLEEPVEEQPQEETVEAPIECNADLLKAL